MIEERAIGPLHQDKNQPDRQKGKDIDSIKSQRSLRVDGIHLTCKLWQSLRELVAVYPD